jgi:monovalent cation:H+ antiporter, CPA1 family
MPETQITVRILILLLLVASAVAMATKWVRVPYTLALVIVGLVISPMHFLPAVHISPDLILLIFLPALLFEAAWNLKLDQLRRNLLPILVLAVAGVVLSTGVIGVILHYGLGLSWRPALLFGAMISATDPVSVLALFKTLALPPRLATIVEGESLLNDGTAVVVFRIILVGAAGSSAGGVALSSLGAFLTMVVGGILAGVIVGVLASTLTSYFDDHLLEITLTTIAAYGSFLLAEGLHVSPVIAVLSTGLVIGNYGRQRGMSPPTQLAVNSFWEYAAFVVNSLVFLLIGLEIQVATLAENVGPLCWAVGATLVARLAAVFFLIPVSNLFGEKLSLRWQSVLVWGGLRGSLSIALVLSLPVAVSARAQLVTMVFGSVIFSLLVQGLTIGPLIKWLGFARPEPRWHEQELVGGRILANAGALAELNEMRRRGDVTEHVYKIVQEDLSREGERLRELNPVGEELEQRQLTRVQCRLLAVKKARLADLSRQGMLSEEVHRELGRELDQDRLNVDVGDE